LARIVTGPLALGGSVAEILDVTCVCGGFQVRGTLDDVLPVVQAHGRDVHNMDVTAEQVRAMSVVVPE
jgi:hypothetical protein